MNLTVKLGVLIRCKNWRHIFRMYVVYFKNVSVSITNSCRFIFLDHFSEATKKILKRDEMSYFFANSVPSTTKQRSPESNWES